MTTYPKRVKLFLPWAKAMVAGATVDKPSYSANRKTKGRKSRGTSKRRRRRKKKAASGKNA